MDNSQHASVHDTLTIGERVWTIIGVFLGGLNEESVLGIRVEGERHDATAHGKDLLELFVPEIMIRRLIESGQMALHKDASQ